MQSPSLLTHAVPPPWPFRMPVSESGLGEPCWAAPLRVCCPQSSGHRGLGTAGSISLFNCTMLSGESFSLDTSQQHFGSVRISP